ncbi:MAG: TonB-dependent receptor [Mucilaginibacter polytrichastri]|nr:TonB-dependent receptor [Mucilaginibacter polytrichastri]
MKKYLPFLFLLFPALASAQINRQVSGSVQDTLGGTIPGAVVKLFIGTDSTQVATDENGQFRFPRVAKPEFRITVQSIGYTPVNLRLFFDTTKTDISLPPIKMKAANVMLGIVNVDAKGAVTVKEDTLEYRVKDFPVREGAPVEDVLRKLPGVDVDRDGNVTAQGKSVSRVRVNGKDFFGGDVKTATQNLPADVIESLQVVDDYGDQANMTGVRSGEPDKILNIVVRKDRNKGYFGQVTAGGGKDAVPAQNDARYVGNISANSFNNDQQISLIGNLNNTNLNTFTFSGGGGNRGGGGNFGGRSGGFGGGGNGGGGGGRGRGNAIRMGGMGANSTTVPMDGLNNNRSIGLNYRDDWGKKMTVYGSYSFSDMTTNTLTNQLQITNGSEASNRLTSNANQNDENVNHRFNFNLEYRPDSLNYIKFSPTFSYSNSTSAGNEVFEQTRNNSVTAGTLNSTNALITPLFDANLLFNHRFRHRGRNLSLNLYGNTNKNTQDQTADYDYTRIGGAANPSQVIDINNRANSLGIHFSYMEPLGKLSFLEANYDFNRNYTLNNRRTDTLTAGGGLVYSDLLSNVFDYTFTTNRYGLNYRFIGPKLNYTIGFGVQPAVLDGRSATRNIDVRSETVNFIPSLQMVYRFSRTQSFNFNYDGNNSQPTFNQLQPVSDLSDARFPVEGNPNLKAEFNNNLRLRYNRFDFQSGNLLLANVSFTQTNDKIVTDNINLGQNPTGADSIYAANSVLTRYRNASGFYSANGFFLFSKPFAERKFTLSYNGFLNYNNNIGYIDNVKNTGRNWMVTNGLRFRVNIADIMDTELNTSYTVNRTNNSLQSPTIINTNVNTTNLGLAGKQYFFKDWTLGYDYTKTINRGYSQTIAQNPNILNAYIERRFMKNNAATIRISGFDLFKENVGVTNIQNANQTTQSLTNRLSRYYLLTFTYRLQKFSGGVNPMEQNGPDGRRMRFDRPPGGGPPNGGPPPPGGPSSYN